MNKDFNDFLESKNKVPSNLDQMVVSNMKEKMRVKPLHFSLKFFSIYFFSGALTLSICPQFGVGPIFMEGHGIAHHFMMIHPIVCAVFCGAFFSVLGASLSYYLLNIAEHKYIKPRLSIVVSLNVLSWFVIFGLMNHFKFSGYFYQLEYILFWFLSAILISYLFTKLRQNQVQAVLS